MGISLGWVVFFVAGVTAAPPADQNAAHISYTVRMAEADGVGWREAVFTRLKPVARQGAATVWTLPKNAAASLIQEITRNPSGTIVEAPRVTAHSGVPATIQVRGNRKFVTQVAWNGDEIAAKGTPEDVRVGWHTTMVGRKLDQGILVKMVFEDTEIRGVHHVMFDRSSQPKNANSPLSGVAAPETLDGVGKVAGLTAKIFAGSPFEQRGSPVIVKEVEVCCQETSGTATGTAPCCRTFAELDALRARKDALELPEIASQEILGEWLIPKGECLLVSFGPHTVADKDGQAVVRERVAVIEADEQTGVGAITHRAMTAAPLYFIPAPPAAIAPPAAPSGAYVPFAPDAPAVYANPVPVAPAPAAAGFRPIPLTPIAPPTARAPIHAPSAPSGPSVATDGGPVLAPAAPVGPAAKMPMPAVPERSFPQGIHVDGSKATLPPLPEDEMEDESAESESAEPLPSPQTRKPRKPTPASDDGTTKATFTQPRSSTVFLPSVFLPGSSVGFQFLLPIRPLSLRLPFNQRLEIEIFGRVVPEPRSSDGGK